MLAGSHLEVTSESSIFFHSTRKWVIGSVDDDGEDGFGGDDHLSRMKREPISSTVSSSGASGLAIMGDI